MQRHAPLLLFSVGGDPTRGGEGDVAHVDSGILDEVAAILWDHLAAHSCGGCVATPSALPQGSPLLPASSNAASTP
jgi:hypothetical protein